MSNNKSSTIFPTGSAAVEVTTVVALVMASLIVTYSLTLSTPKVADKRKFHEPRTDCTRKSDCCTKNALPVGGIHGSSNSTSDLAISSHGPLQLSKKGMKKQLKYERKVQNRKLKRQIEREKRHQEALRNGRNIQDEQSLVIQRTLVGDGWRRRQMIWENEKLSHVQTSFHVCIDCSYEQYMTKKEITSLAAQVRCCYAYNKRSDQPCQMVVTNLSAHESPQTLRLLQQEKGYTEWVNRAYCATSLSPYEYYSHPGTIFEVPKTESGLTGTYAEHQYRRMSKLVYLTSDSNTTLTRLDDDTVYIIGGIVDRNRYKGIAYERAQSLLRLSTSGGDSCPLPISTAKLPLSEYIVHMPSTPVLTINHVFHILLLYRQYDNNWNAAFQNVLLARKEAQYLYR